MCLIKLFPVLLLIFRKLFVGGLSWETSESKWKSSIYQNCFHSQISFICSKLIYFYFLIFTEELREHFSKFGEIESINVKTDPQTGRSRGFAFIVFASTDAIDKVNEAGEHVINNKKVDPKKAKARHGKIFVGGLTTEISDDEIKTYFSQFGNVSILSYWPYMY